MIVCCQPVCHYVAPLVAAIKTNATVYTMTALRDCTLTADFTAPLRMRGKDNITSYNNCAAHSPYNNTYFYLSARCLSVCLSAASQKLLYRSRRECFNSITNWITCITLHYFLYT